VIGLFLLYDGHTHLKDTISPTGENAI